MNILLVGATGNMGRVVSEICENSQKYNIVAGIGAEENLNHIYPIYNNFSMIKQDIDVILDFSYHELISDILKFSKEKKLPLVISTTGYSNEQIIEIEESSKKIPILFSGNMSIGINILLNIVENLSKNLVDFDIEIIEKHHNLKKDSPSGTAKMLFDSVNKGRDDNLSPIYGRHGNGLLRESSEVGIHAIRGGTIVGEHTVLFSGLDEVLEITHKAKSKKIFAMGALRACDYILSKNVGLYSMKDIFNF